MPLWFYSFFNEPRTKTCPLCSNWAEVTQWLWWMKLYTSFNFSIYKLVPLWDLLRWKLYEKCILTVEPTKDSHHWDESALLPHWDALREGTCRHRFLLELFIHLRNTVIYSHPLLQYVCVVALFRVNVKNLKLFKCTVWSIRRTQDCKRWEQLTYLCF